MTVPVTNVSHFIGWLHLRMNLCDIISRPHNVFSCEILKYDTLHSTEILSIFTTKLFVEPLPAKICREITGHRHGIYSDLEGIVTGTKAGAKLYLDLHPPGNAAVYMPYSPANQISTLKHQMPPKRVTFHW